MIFLGRTQRDVFTDLGNGRILQEVAQESAVQSELPAFDSFLTCSNPDTAPQLFLLKNALGGGALTFGICMFMCPDVTAVFMIAGGIAAGFLYGQQRFRKKQLQKIEEIEVMLPIVMERLVMAVQSGLDVVAGVQAIIRLTEEGDTNRETNDVVTKLLTRVIRLSEAGLGFGQALRQIASTVPCIALKHAFIHLAVAYEQGGELVFSLRELSDSTQLSYQETIEERIAKLPAKATIPLVLTFAGLILIFITPPLLQVMNVMSRIDLP